MTMKKASPSPSPVKRYPHGSLLGKLRQRGIISALAAFVGSGWLVYEIVHFILVEHYGLPEGLKDITIVSVLAATLSTLTWRWFRGEQRARRPRWELVLIPVFIVAAAAADLNYILHFHGHGRDPAGSEPEGIPWRSSIAVLPFVNMSADKEQEYFCDGLTEEMINRLSQIPELKVTARTSAFVFKGEAADIREVGRRLGVENVLEGSVRRDGGRLRISAQLIKVADGFHLWSEAYDRDLDRIFQTQDEIALAVADALKLTLLGPRNPPPQTRSLEAYDEFLRGQSFYMNPTGENLGKAIAHFERAIDLDPDYATAWAYLAGAQAMQAGFGRVPPDVGFSNATASIDRALELDGRLALAYSIKGWILMSYDWDWAAAEASYATAQSLQPGWEPLGSSQMALALGRSDRAIRLARRAAVLDSQSATAQMNLALSLFYAGRLDEARESFAAVFALSPARANAHALLAQVYLLESLPEQALEELEKERDEIWRLPTQAMVNQALGRAMESREALAKFIDSYRDGNAYQIAQVYAYLGDPDEAFRWLEEAYRQRDGGLFLIAADPFFKPLRSDPRFPAFLKKMGFPFSP